MRFLLIIISVFEKTMASETSSWWNVLW